MIESVFLIDDSELDNFVSRNVIQQAKYSNNIMDFLFAGNALDFLRSIESDQEDIPNVIFLDINMPVINGFEFLKEFETLPGPVRKKAKIVILSSSLNPSDIEKTTASPYVIKYLNKPLSVQKLKELNF